MDGLDAAIEVVAVAGGSAGLVLTALGNIAAGFTRKEGRG